MPGKEVTLTIVYVTTLEYKEKDIYFSLPEGKAGDQVTCI
jgi:hypothetical protein